MKTVVKLALMPWLCVLILSCGSSDTDTDPVDPGVDVTMGQGQNYPVFAYDRLVNTSPDPARVRVVFELNEAAGTTAAEVTLLEGTADLFR